MRIGKQARAILEPYLSCPPDGPVFSPSVASTERAAIDCGPSEKRTPWSVCSYRRAVKDACKAADFHAFPPEPAAPQRGHQAS